MTSNRFSIKGILNPKIALLVLSCLLAFNWCYSQTGNDIITCWTGTVDPVSLKVTDLPTNGKVIQLASATIVSNLATFKILNNLGVEVSMQSNLSNDLSIEVRAQNGDAKLYTIALGTTTIPTETVSDITTTLVSINNKILDISGRSTYHITKRLNPLEGSIVNLQSEDVWLYFDSIKPSAFKAKYLDHILINGQPAIIDTTARLVQYLQGCVLISQAATYQPLEIFSGENFTGATQKIGLYTFYRSNELGSFNNAIASFKLKKGYMATIAENDLGTGQSRVYVAADSDIVINQLPVTLNNKISFVRVFPWRWVVKKGWTSNYSFADTLNCSWNYNWNNDQNSTLDEEYVPIRQTQWWPSLTTTNNKKNVTAVLGFNEPNSTSQSNLTPDQAFAAWPSLMESGLRLGSPAVTDGGANWLYSFMDKCDSAGYRVDFIAVHFYRGCQTAAQFYGFLKAIYDRTHRPIWITEFNNGANWTTSTGCPAPTYSEQATKIGQFLNMMDTARIVERYSLYEWVQTTRQMFFSANPIVLNPAGIVYRDKVSPMAFNPMAYVSSKATQVTTGTFQSAVKAPVLRLEVNTSGTGNPLSTLQFVLNTNGTTNPADIVNAKIFYTGNSATFATTKLFGEANLPNGIFTITGTQTLAEGINYFWLTYDVACGTAVSNLLDGEFISSATTLQLINTPSIQAPAGSVSVALAINFSTVADGDWADAGIWACGLPPLNNTQPVLINNNVSVTTAVLAGNVTITAGDTLTIAGGALTLGASSEGNATGNSNKVLSVEGTLAVAGGKIDVNGELYIKPTGGFIMSDGIINIDGNDGTAAGSIANEPFFLIQSPRINVTGGNINILDPAYSINTGNPLSQRSLSYDNVADAVMGCTLTFGGGDDINPTTPIDPAKQRGFYITTGAGTTGSLEVGTMVINGGNTIPRQVTTSGNLNFVTKVHNLIVNAGAELLINAAPVIVTGNLVNNGLITSTSSGQGQWMVLAGGSKYGSPVASVVNFLPSDSAQFISGTGFFKHGATAAVPTSQSGNLLSGITVYHTNASPGVTLQMPLTLLNIRLMKGKINTSSASPLALGYGTSLPGNPLALTPSTGTLYQFVNTGQGSGTSPATTALYNGGWVNGPFSRWVTATTTTGQQGILPLGTDTTCPAQVLFTTAPVTGGYLTAQWFDTNPGIAGLPLTEAAVTPGVITKVAPGYWQVTKDGALSGGIYKAVFTNNSAQEIVDFANVTLLKRETPGSDWALQGMHVAAAGSNTAITVARDGLSDFSEFGIGGGSGVLPITFEYLKGSQVNAGNLLTWKITTNDASTIMELEKSANALSFKSITSIVATGIRSMQPFFYTDAQLSGASAYYRLKMIDEHGKVSYSAIVAILNATKEMDVIGMYPAIFSNRAYLSISAPKDCIIKISITNTFGSVVYSTTNRLACGTNLLPIDGSHLPGGMYHLTVYNEETRINKTVRFVINR